jgi:hypothetical protein
MSQVKGTPINGPQAKRSGYMTPAEEEASHKALVEKGIRERQEQIARDAQSHTIIGNAYNPGPTEEYMGAVTPGPNAPLPTIPDDFVETPVPAFTAEPVVEYHVPAVPATLPEHSGQTLKVVEEPSYVDKDGKLWGMEPEGE